jgi:hypothetical protein
MTLIRLREVFNVEKATEKLSLLEILGLSCLTRFPGQTFFFSSLLAC